jgi:hypothetical protein
MLRFQEHKHLDMYENQVMMDMPDDEEQEMALTERSFSKGSNIARRQISSTALVSP